MEKFKNNVNWEDSGLLNDVEGFKYSAIKNLLEKINLNYIDNGNVVRVIAPVVRGIATDIVDSIEKNDGRYNNNTLSKVNVNEVMDLLVEFCDIYLPISKKYLNNIGYEAEILNLFVKNYLSKISK